MIYSRKSEVLRLAEIYSHGGMIWKLKLKNDNELRFLKGLVCVAHLDSFLCDYWEAIIRFLI